MAEHTTAIQVRMNTELKDEAEKIFDAIGLTISEAMRLFLKQVVNSGGLPFQPTVKPNVEAELKRLQRIIKADQAFAEMRQGNYTEG